MPESPKVDLLFEYTRSRDGIYSGTATFVESESQSVRPPLHRVVHQPEWVEFVVETIKAHPEVCDVMFVIRGREKETHHPLDHRTVEKIRDGSLGAEDLVL